MNEKAVNIVSSLFSKEKVIRRGVFFFLGMTAYFWLSR